MLIDRSGRHFGTILNYLRDGSVPLPESTRELGELLGEARHYLVQGLIEDCQLALQVSTPSAPPESHPDAYVPGLNPRRGLTLLSPVCRDPAIGV